MNTKLAHRKQVHKRMVTVTLPRIPETCSGIVDPMRGLYIFMIVGINILRDRFGDSQNGVLLRHYGGLYQRLIFFQGNWRPGTMVEASRRSDDTEILLLAAVWYTADDRVFAH